MHGLELLGVLALILVLGGIPLGIAGFFLALSARRRGLLHAAEFRSLRREIAARATAGTGAAPAVDDAAGQHPAEQAGTVDPTDHAVGSEAPSADQPERDERVPDTPPDVPSDIPSDIPIGPEAQGDGRLEGASSVPDVPLRSGSPIAASDVDRWAGLERSLSTRWLVWLGGLALALGGVFLVKYAIDFGLLGPRVRVAGGVVLGVLMVLAGEWLRRRPADDGTDSAWPDYVPSALCAAGLATVYGAVYAGLALYAILPAWVAFAVLSVVSAAAIVLSLIHMPYVAALGLLGGFVTPALVSLGKPSAWGLVLFLMSLSAGGFAVARLRGWSWLGWLTLAGSLGWTVLWFVALWRPGDVGAFATYLLFLSAVVAWVAWALGDGDGETGGSPLNFQNLHPAHTLYLGAAVALSLCLYLLVRVDDYSAVSLGAVMAFAAGALAMARRQPLLDSVVPLAALLPLAVLATWRLQSMTVEELFLNGLASDAVAFATFATIVASSFAIAGFALLRLVRRPGLWAGISVATPLLVLVIAYSRSEAFRNDALWSTLALALAAASFAAAHWVARRREETGMDAALGAYAIGVIGGVSLFAAILLENAWLTAVLAVQLPAMAWVNERLRLPVLRPVAIVIASAVFVRLVANPYLLDYPMGPWPGFNWILYGYGLPALAFYVAGRMFRGERDDRLVALLEAGAIVFSLLFVTFEIRHLAGDGQLAYPRYSLFERSIQTIAWLTYSYALFRRQRQHPRVVQFYAWRIIAGLACAHLVLVQLLGQNPLFTGEPVGGTPIFNLLLLVYGVPTVFVALIAREAVHQSIPNLAKAAGIGALLLLFITLNLEVRQIFQGSVITWGSMTDPEWYAYSVAWLALAGLFLLYGIYRAYPLARHASLALVLLAVGKVFLFDMAGLEGLYRAASFFGLGLSLLAVGFIYQRFVYRQPSSDDDGGSDMGISLS